jgi:hypothetical protein
MANDDDKEPPPTPPPPPHGQQVVWVPEQWWEPQLRRNNTLYNSQDTFVPPPMEPPSETPSADAGGDEIEARFQDIERRAAELTAAIDQLRGAIAASPADREIGIGHNQGPPLSIEELDAESQHLLVLLKDKGPRPPPVDIAPIVEQAKKTLELSERIWQWLRVAGITVASIGVHEVTKDLTKPLWEEAARRIVDLYHAIEAWISVLPF